MAQNSPNIIKVVKIKQFLPGINLITRPQVSNNWVFPIIQTESLNEGVNETTHTGNAQESMIEPNNYVPKQDETNEMRTSESLQRFRMIADRSKITFRKCAHTAEELSNLHEHFHETLVKVGDTFESRDTFRQYLNDNGKRWYYYYVCRNSKEKIIEYNCICMPYNSKGKKEGLRKHKGRTTACPCKIRLLIDKETNKVKVYYVCNHHDHKTTAATFYHYPHAKYLPLDIKEDFLDLAYIGIDVDLIQKHILSLIGIKIKRKDISSYVYRFKKNTNTRKISQERLIYLRELITRLYVGFNNPDPQYDASIENSGAYEHVNVLETEPKLKKYIAKEQKYETPEVLIQYVNEDGKLCDANGDLLTNSSAILQFIDNKYVPDNNKTLIDGIKIPSEEDKARELDYVQTPSDIALMDACVKRGQDVELAPHIDKMIAEVCLQSNDVFEKTLDEYMDIEGCRFPTAETAAVYAEKNIFKKYFYVDHRYISLDTEQETDKRDPVKNKGKKQESGTSFQPDLSLADKEFIKAPDSGFPTSIRRCTRHGHLTKLDDPDAILPGAKFLTHEIFLKYINERASRWYFYYTLLQSIKSPESYVYKCVYGKYRACRSTYRSKGLRKRKQKITTECPCLIRLRRLESSSHLTVLYSCNHHDHTLNEKDFLAQPHSRFIPSHIKEEVKDLLTLRVGTGILRQYVAAETGIQVYRNYFVNVRLSMRSRHEQRQFTEERLQELTQKIKELEAKYGKGAKENLKPVSPQIPVEKLNLSPPLQVAVQMEVGFTPIHLEDAATQTTEFCELSDRNEFAEEVCIDEDGTSQNMFTDDSTGDSMRWSRAIIYSAI